MKFLYISNQRLPTEKAYGIQIAKMCEAFSNSGVSVELLVPHRQNLIRDDFFEYYGINKNFTIKKIWAPDFYFPGKLDRLAVIIKSFISASFLVLKARTDQFDIIYSRDEWPLYLLSFKSRKIVFEAHNFSRARMFFYNRFLNKKIKIVVISNELKKSFLEIGFKEDQIIIAHDGVDLREFSDSITKEEAREITKLALNRKIIMYVGHLFPWKGVGILADLADRLPDIDFVFVGGTDNDVDNFRNKYSSKDNIKIIGRKPHSEIPVFLKAADLLVLPNSAKERISLFTSPLKMFEYMAAQRPIVASDLPSIREVLNENNALLVKPDNPNALADGISKILNNKDLADKISNNGYEDVVQHTWAMRAKRILNFI